MTEQDNQHDTHPTVDLYAGPVELTRQLVDIYSESLHEQQIADALEKALRQVVERNQQDGVEIDLQRRGHTLVARTHRGLGSRLVLAGHIDTVPPADNLPSRRAADPETKDATDTIFGLGSVDMKSGAACYAHAFAELAGDPDLVCDLTLVLYEGEEVATKYNGLNHIVQSAPELLAGDFALLGEPTAANVEAGCQGTIRVKVTAHGTRAHSARAWLGHNALHELARVLVRVGDYEPQNVMVDGLEYREGLNAVIAESGVATNTIPDEAWAFVNYRYAPTQSTAEALNHVWEVLGVGTPESPAEGFSLEIDDVAAAASPGLDVPVAQQFIAVVRANGGEVRPKFGWTDVARFTEVGIPAVNFGPGDPSLCHTPNERCPVWQIEEVSRQLRHFLTTT